MITAPPGGLPCLPLVGCNPAGQIVGAGASAIARSVFDAFSNWIAEGTAALLGRVGALITKPVVQLNTLAFTHEFDRMKDVGVSLVLPMLLAAVIGAVIHRDGARLLRIIGAHVPLAILGSVVAVELTQKGLALTDQLCSKVVQQDSTTGAVAALLHVSQELSVSLGPAAGGFVSVLAMLLVALGAMLIWLELLVRTSAIYIAVFFLPAVLAGLVWPTTARWTRRLVELLVALVLSKFVIVAVLGLGTALMADKSDQLGVLAPGAAILMMAGFAPFALLRMVPLVEASLIGHLEGMERRPVSAGVSGVMSGMSLYGGAEAAAAGVADRAVERTAGSSAGVFTLLDHASGGDLDQGRQSPSPPRARGVASFDSSSGVPGDERGD